MPKILFISFKGSGTQEERLKRGYKKMARVNLSIANMCIDADSTQLSVYEEKLAESEKY